MCKSYDVSPEPPTPLLVHLGSGGHAIHCHEEHLLGRNDPEENLDVVEDVIENLLLCDSEHGIAIVGMRADVNDSIHVKIEVIK